ncbi:MAG TPA: FecR domain-containing protein [Leptospiraceae bacterium]|nr:FecR domain-containing protein [Leptospiraceae bacterium]HNI98532.1 FecR domain-containing protein [Leptospiraceae bacterium]HNM03777.1 FecR domain-containing protein [Leptospiraceae bacterium]HNO24383.1 FecR domain-containing protein [Leptospiraceae bacterium]
MRYTISFITVLAILILSDCRSVPPQEQVSSEPEEEKRTPEQLESLRMKYRNRNEKKAGLAPGYQTEKPPSQQERIISVSSPIRIEPAAKVAFAVGNPSAILAAGRKRTLKKGDTVLDGEIIETGNSGTCDLEFSGKSKVIIRVKPKSVFKVSRNTAGEGESQFLDSGSIAVKAEKTDKKGFKLNTHAWVVGVRGTEFDVSADDKNSDIKMDEGEVSLLPFIPELELVQNKKGSFFKLFYDNAVKAEKGEDVSLSAEKKKEFTEKSGLNNVLNDASSPDFENRLNQLAESDSFKKSFLSFLQTAKEKRVPENCRGTKIPAELIEECTDTHILLKLDTKENRNKYYQMHLNGNHFEFRLQAYDYFSGECPEYASAKNTAEERLKRKDTVPAETEKAEKLLDHFRSCGSEKK